MGETYNRAMGRPRTLLTLVVIFLAGARAAQRHKTKRLTGQPASQPGNTPAKQSPSTGSTNATGRLLSLWTMIGTVLAGIAALAALVVSYMTFTIQQQQNDDQRQRRAASFASKVTWWTERAAQDQVTTLVIQNSGYEPMPASITFMQIPESPSPSPAFPVLVTMGQGMIGALPPCSISRLKLAFKDDDIWKDLKTVVWVTVTDPLAGSGPAAPLASSEQEARPVTSLVFQWMKKTLIVRSAP
ncbi:hypothetical protein [Nonomuraea sp. 10N515B]|uniref:hypothetical protein n=1 Tax=Nonomuraea sp. 10N515B TaxID=3457422 RepID=UPI003FCD22ED